MDKNWQVEVWAGGESILSIGDNHLSGVENIDGYKKTIIGCAEHLLAFIGAPSVVNSPDPYAAERERAEREHPASEWANKTPDEMFSDLFNEVSELGIAVEADDLHGPHGVLIEALHVRIVAERIAEEMTRRAIEHDRSGEEGR